jgi:glutathione reductase (NADPH)
MPIAKLEGRVVATNVLKGNNIKPDYTGIPSVVFMVPALACRSAGRRGAGAGT